MNEYMINILEKAPIRFKTYNDRVSTLIGPNRDLVELQRIVLHYNDMMLPEDQVQLDIFPNEDGEERAILTGTGMGLFHIGTRIGKSEERKYLKDLGPSLREIMIG